MKYDQFEVEDFLNDEFFIQWVKHPGDETDHFWLKWIGEHPEKLHLIQKAREIILFIDYKDKSVLSDKYYMDLYENIVEKSNITIPDHEVKFPWKNWHKVAAILIVVVSSVYCLRHFLSNDKMISSSDVPEMITKCNPSGQKTGFRLPDGTVVYLNASSKLTYPSVFKEDERRVSMKGEAYFDVAEDKERPFIIETGDDIIKVLGTSFNLVHSNNELKVALVKGSVAYEDAEGNTVRIKPNQMLVKDKNGKVSKTPFDMLEVTGWKDKYLIFKDDGFVELSSKLEKWFGVKIVSDLKVDSTWSYSGVYHDKSLEYVLEGISIASDFDFKINQKKITITNPNNK
ncbi:FecR family protein [Echinicola sp. 20G]|uniref:FecR family protein n=1 Tax=Echinicola sp. 20G TaxID=2781961 RepID=UPI00191022D2|nr:FecR family protein [Echinicola sp. 20G]